MERTSIDVVHLRGLPLPSIPTSVQTDSINNSSIHSLYYLVHYILTG